MKTQAFLIFNARKIYFFGALIGLLYGLSPQISIWLFNSKLPGVSSFSIYFLICWVLWLIICCPLNCRLISRIEVNESRLRVGIILAAAIFVVTQCVYYGDFTKAFIVAYTERTGVEQSDGINFLLYPITTAFTSIVLLFTIHLYARPDRINIFNLASLIVSVLIFSALGSRNLLLWSLSALLALFLSRMRYRTILLLVVGIYIFAVLFAYARNAGLVAYLSSSIDQLTYELHWEYFDPVIHEFGSSYRTFNLIESDSNAAQYLINHAPYGQFTSFFINLLPSFMKPSGFISFTNFISLSYAVPGEGIGSSPMTEAYLSSMASLASLSIVLALAFWPGYYFSRCSALSFFTYVLAVAVCFNVWRIGSAEILKMLMSSVVTLFILAKVCGFRVLLFKRNFPQITCESTSR